ncbi:MAG: hypothetical protein PHI34_14345 [Acidobacteriota bacterium]|nr:hypothetical protein [Acidobacteriota bacterium]
MDKKVTVDHDNLNVAELGERIKTAAAVRTAPPATEPVSAPIPDPPEMPMVEPAAPPVVVPSGLKSRLKGLLIRLLRPFFPLMRILVLPLHEDVAALYRQVDASNRRNDKFIDYIKLLHMLDHNLVVELTKLRIEHEALKSKMRLMEKDLAYLTKRERSVEERVFPE